MEIELLSTLAEELATCLEMNYPDAKILKEVWGDALVGLTKTKCLLEERGVATPQSVLNVLSISAGAPAD